MSHLVPPSWFLGATLLLWGLAGSTAAAPAALSLEEAVRQALAQSPAVSAAQSRLEAAAARLQGARSPFSPVLEVAPGVGFTNGNALLSQRLDIGGRRAAEGRAATGEQAAAEAGLLQVRLEVAAEAQGAYYDLARAHAAEAVASESVELVRQIRDAIRRRVEIGDAPAVQATRADIELARAEQDLLRTRREVQTRLTTLNLLLGRPVDAALELVDRLAVPAAPEEAAALRKLARQGRPEMGIARGVLEARRGALAVARAERRPDLYAEVAADVWSLDRDPFQSRNLGFQARVSLPLFDRGRLRSDVKRAEAEVRQGEAELNVAERRLLGEVERAAAALSAAREVALNYEQTILPQSQSLLQATRAGFETGLSSFLEVLEAQRVARQTQSEYQNAVYDAVRARVELDRALGVVPGLPAAPSPPPVSRDEQR